MSNVLIGGIGTTTENKLKNASIRYMYYPMYLKPSGYPTGKKRLYVFVAVKQYANGKLISNRLGGYFISKEGKYSALVTDGFFQNLEKAGIKANDRIVKKLEYVSINKKIDKKWEDDIYENLYDYCKRKKIPIRVSETKARSKKQILDFYTKDMSKKEFQDRLDVDYSMENKFVNEWR